MEYKTYLGDCLDVMKTLDTNSIDVSFTSPPYNDKGTKNCDVSSNKFNGCNHKKYIYVEQRNDWLEWQIECVDEMLRVSKRYVIYNIQALKSNRQNVYKLIGHYADRIHDILIWYKPNGLPTGTPNKISNTYELVLILKCDGIDSVNVNSKFYRNVIVKNTNPNREFAKIHRAVMNQDFCDEIIKEFTKENDYILDCFMGLGTTGISCINQHRNFVGIELAQEYFDIANKRLDETNNINENLIVQETLPFDDLLEED